MQAVITNPRGGFVAAINAGVRQALREEAEATAKAAAQANTTRLVRRLQGSGLSEVATMNGFQLENGVDSVHELRCIPCLFFANKRGQKFEPIKFNNISEAKVKERMVRHQGTALHSLANKEYVAEKERREAETKTGYILGRIAYKVIREGQSYLSYEREIELAHVNGAPHLGNLHHSEKFVRDMLPNFVTALKEKMAKFLATPQELLGGRLPPLAINADKGTTKGRTGHIIGALMLDPGRGEIIGVMLADSVVAEGDSDAAGLSAAILKAIKDFIPDNEACKEQITAFCFDGQYIVGGVPKELWAKLTGGKSGWVTIQWDGAHKLELVLHDVREDKTGTVKLHEVDFYKPFLAEVTEIAGSFRVGKAGEVIRRMVVDMNEESAENGDDPIRWLMARIFCDTRFSQSEQGVYNVVIRMFPVWAAYFEEQSRTREKSDKRNKADVAEAQAKLDKLTCMGFVCILLAMFDLFIPIVETSLASQKARHAAAC